MVDAEVKFGYFISEHHLAFALADQCSKLFPTLFPDSEIAKSFKCGHTKATAIAKVLRQEVMNDILININDSQFSIQIGG